jgi:succinate-semialdehyde dehydrogenase / glutarate-semialdehyde dehydrogenase
MKKFSSINPYTGKLIESFELHSQNQVEEILKSSAKGFHEWKSTVFYERSNLLMNTGTLLRSKKKIFSECISNEMGKPIAESYSEIEKCAWVCDYYARNSEQFLQDEKIITDADKSYVKYQPLGAILAIMPWNFPFWQVFRFAAPALMAGNVCLLKHAPNVLRCALHIQDVFSEAGLPDGVFQNLVVDVEDIPAIIENDIVKAVTLTGSEAAGASVAALAGRNIKKTVLELGGSNAFVVLKDADLELAAKIGTQARMQNTGQSCIAAKRFIVVKEVAEKFIELLRHNIESLQLGNPMEESTQMGVLARMDLADKLEKQMQDTINQGAKLLTGGKRDETKFTPAILTDVLPGMTAFEEELFGPVAPVTIAESEEDALRLANQSRFGLGISVFTKNEASTNRFIKQSDDGAVFINTLVKSDPRLPFGGTKHSGYGRELSMHGIREFVNVKTVYVKGIH